MARDVSLMTLDIECVRCGCVSKTKASWSKGQTQGEISWTCPDCGVTKRITMTATPQKEVPPYKPSKNVEVTRKQHNVDGSTSEVTESGEKVEKEDAFPIKPVRASKKKNAD